MESERDEDQLESGEGREGRFHTLNNGHFVETAFCLHLLEMCTYIGGE